jgi:hypothetical protein
MAVERTEEEREMKYEALKRPVYNRGVPKDSFIDEILAWGKTMPEESYARNNNYDIFNLISPELGPWTSLEHRRAALLLVLIVLGMFESSGNWHEGIDSSRSGSTTNENAEAGAWQVSWNNRKLDPSLKSFLTEHGINDGVTFQQMMKSDHNLAMAFICLLLRIDVQDYERINNGPVRKGEARAKTWPFRPKLWNADESIYPWLHRDAVDEIQHLLA